MNNKYILRIFRGCPGCQYWEEFELEYNPDANVISALMEIQKNPVNRLGLKTTPVAWEQGCLEEVCGSCSMLVNGVPRQACTALIRDYTHGGTGTITLAPLTKFRLIRDLQVDRTSMFEALKKVRAWISASSGDSKEFGVKVSPELQESLYPLATCMTCGCCSESCPQVSEKSSFMGPAAMSQVRLFNSNPSGEIEKSVRLRSVLGEDGIAACGNAQNCARVCPKKIPLIESIPFVNREATKQALKDFFSLPDTK
ncbi:MAG: Succinate dehydrogenase iron-sulfur subunit [Parachlamydiales bacterium]|nr:Succinate dehydrogenase iron-sulfur subunit [Parachlamydiales bacterium]